MKTQKSTNILLLGILICLILMTLSDGTNYIVQPPSDLQIINNRETVIQLSNNRIALVDSSNNSDTYGLIFVFDYDDESKTFVHIATYDYKDFISNSYKYIENKKTND